MSLTIERFVEAGFGWPKPSPNSQKCYRNHISQFEDFLKSRNKTASDETVTDQDILDYIEQLKSKYSPNTVATKVAAIKSYFKWLTKQGLIHKPIIQSQKNVKSIHKELSNSDLETVIKHFAGDGLYTRRDSAMFSLVIYCGFKTGEVVTVNTEDIDFENAEITVKKQKCSFRAAFKEIKTYADDKLQKGFHWKPLLIDGFAKDEKEPFFLSKRHLRIGARSLRRRLMASMSATHNMRDLRHTYLQNLNRITKIELEVEQSGSNCNHSLEV